MDSAPRGAGAPALRILLAHASALPVLRTDARHLCLGEGALARSHTFECIESTGIPHAVQPVLGISLACGPMEGRLRRVRAIRHRANLLRPTITSVKLMLASD